MTSPPFGQTTTTHNEEFLRFQALQEQQVMARFDQLVARMAEQSAAVSEEEVAADVDAARDELDD